ncbi:uncharacterized protein K02A2.6-like isoform X2 [Ixodes scapularis]|uniref:uncharacterized protein K02A2.6-like isoform X2 n=1 Tax=Ixodes scapularis TaxID=6945 RepID=UPI001A9D5530|nr:uncharacterized protein K02A2.6-like isoform X2 [Ixodes scapularis]
MTAMKTSARAYIWWPKIDQAIEDFVRHCQQCQENRQSDPKAPVHFWIKPEQPWSRLHVDFAGPVRGESFLVVVDAFSNWAEVEIMPSTKSAAVITALRKLFATHGLPDVIVSDNGTAFKSAEMKEFLKLNAVRFIYTAPYHPASNGRAERMHTTPHSDTGKTPGEVMMGRRLRSPLDRLHPDLQRDPGADQPKVKRFYVGDTVYARNFVTGPRWKAAKVVAVTGPVSYKVQLANREVYRRHRDHLRKAWLDWDENLEADIDYDVKLPLTAAPGHGTPQASPARRNPERPVPQVVPSPAAQPEQPLRRSARERRPVIRYGTVPT